MMTQSGANLKNLRNSEHENGEVTLINGMTHHFPTSLTAPTNPVGPNTFELWSPFQHSHQQTSDSIFHELQSRKIALIN